MTDKSFCEPLLYTTTSYKDLLTYTLQSGGVTTKYAYFVTTWPSNQNFSTATSVGWGFDYLKCKYLTGLSVKSSFFFSDTLIEVATQVFSNSYCSGWTGTAPISKYFSQNYFVADGTDTTLVH